VLVLSENDSQLLVRASRRGRPPTLSLHHLALALLLGVLQGARHLSTIWRRLSLEAIGPFAPVQVTYEAVRKRLLSRGVAALQQLFEHVTLGLAHLSQSPSACSLAPFASQIVALDESTLDRLRRLTDDLRNVPNRDPHLLPGKLACLFDLRTQRLVRVQFRADVLAACNTALLLLLEGLAPGSLILADLGYFSFPWFDYLTGQGYFWVSRLKDNVSYDLKEVFAYDDGTGLLDAVIWLGKYRANRAAHAVRLVCFTVGGTRYRYLTNVLSPSQLSMQEIAQLYARRWDIEMAFNLLKSELGLHLWWGACPQLVLAQLWIALILAQLLYGVQRHLALQAQVDPGEVSMHVLIELLSMSPVGPTPLLERLVQQGRALGLIRPSRRFTVTVPPIQPHMLCSAVPGQDCMRHARYARPKAPARSAPFVSRFQTQLLI
jgi:Transposase DDE domain